MKNPKYYLGAFCLFFIFLFCNASRADAQTPSLIIDYEPVVCIENNNAQCRTYVEISVNATGFCSGLSITHNSPFSGGEDPSGIYLSGSYDFEVRASDNCGNELTENVRFEVKDCQPPTAICRYGVSLSLSSSCEITLDADFMDAGSLDNCSGSSDLRYQLARIDEDGNYLERDESLKFINVDEGNQLVALFVTDTEGNESVCETVVEINCGSCEDSCPDETNNDPIITGEFYTMSGHPINNVGLFLGKEYLGRFDSPYEFDLTSLGLMILNGQLCAEKYDEVRNGVSTIDLVLIRRNILGLSSFNVFQKIAADVNNDLKVSTRDMLEIRKLILGEVDEFSGVPSWRMYRTDLDLREFDSRVWQDPIGFDENFFCYEVSTVSESEGMKMYSFTGLKLGDVNGDANKSSGRENHAIALNTSEKVLRKGSVIDVPFSTNREDLLGYQMTLEFDADALELLSWSGELADYNMNAARAEQGVLGISRVTEGSRSRERFSLKFKVKENAILSEVLHLSDAILRTEGYTDLQSRRPIKIVFEEKDYELALRAFPNPFVDQVALEFNVEESGDYQLELFNAQGQKVYSQNWSVVGGENLQILRREEINVAEGWHLARVTGPKGVFTHSLIVR